MSATAAAPLVLAVPSKGRLKEAASAFFARAGLALKQGGGGRDYSAQIPALPGVEVLLLSASEIADAVAAGRAHFGVTGEDLVREQIADADARAAKIVELGFGHANVVVAAPQSWIDVATMADIDDVAADFREKRGRRLRVATKYVNLTRRFFAAHGVADYRIVESQGATEGAPAAGGAELIVDITSSGATLAANGLKVLDDGTILRSQATLFASLRANWGDGALAAARTMLTRIAAADDAQRQAEVRAHFDQAPPASVESAPETFGAVRRLDGADISPVTFHCAADRAAALAEWLIGKGAVSVAVARTEQMFSPANPLFSRLEAELARRRR